MNKPRTAESRAKPPVEVDPYIVVEDVATRLFKHVAKSFDGLLVVAYKRKSSKGPGEISSTMLSGKALTGRHRKFLRRLIEELPDAAGL